MLSVGVPMISGGDEVGRTQRGNNNAYCQDNEISWTDWDADAGAARLPRVHAARDPDLEGPPGAAAAQVLPGPPHPRRRSHRHRMARSVGPRDDRRRRGTRPTCGCLGVRLNGDAIQEINERGERIVGDTLLLLFNAGDDAGRRSCCRRARRSSAGKRCSTPPIRGSRRAGCAPAIATTLQARSMAVMRLSTRQHDRRRAPRLGTAGRL